MSTGNDTIQLAKSGLAKLVASLSTTVKFEGPVKSLRSRRYFVLDVVCQLLSFDHSDQNLPTYRGRPEIMRHAKNGMQGKREGDDAGHIRTHPQQSHTPRCHPILASSEPERSPQGFSFREELRRQ